MVQKLKTVTNKVHLLCSLLILLFFASVIVGVSRYGMSSRKTGVSGSLDTQGAVTRIIDRPEEAYGVWKESGFKGRVAVCFSRRLNFIDQDERTLISSNSFPLNIHNLAPVIETSLNETNFLYVSMIKGITREIYHVVPENSFSERREFAIKQGVTVTNGSIHIPYRGAPRWIVPLSQMKPIKEPVLLYVNASYFEEVTPEMLFDYLKRINLKTDLVILCRSTDDIEVAPLGRQKLEAFAKMMGTASERK